MRYVVLMALYFCFTLQAKTIATAKVSATHCIEHELIQLIVIKKDVSHQFLYQVGVPHGGTADFNLIPGEYRVEAISDKACFGMKDFTITEEQRDFVFKLELKK